VVKDLGLHKTSGQVDIDLHKLNQFTRGEIFGWLAAFNAKLPPPPEEVEKPESKPTAPVEKPAEPEDDSELRERAVDEAEGLQRIEHYVKLGLIDTPENGTLLLNFVNSTAKGRWSAAIVDAAVVALKGKLTWRKKEESAAPTQPAPQEPAAEPVEVLGNLPSGEPRLPLDVVPSKHHSAAQLRDYLARANAKLPRPRGSWGSKF
jgi:hypothetical protein